MKLYGRLVKLHKKSKVVQEVLEYFMTHHFNWLDDNMKAMFNEMNSTDRKVFQIVFYYVVK